MSYITRPSSTITQGSWTGTGQANLWAALQEENPDDSTYIQGPTSGASTCELKCWAISDPVCDWGHHVRYRYRRTGTGTGSVNLTVKLMCGSTEIASWTHAAIGATVVPTDQTLTAAQANAITDYGNLRLRFTHTTVSGSGYSASVTWAMMETPEVGESGSVSVSPAARTAAAARSDPRVVLGSLVISPAAAVSSGATRLLSVASPSDLSVSPGDPATARCSTAFQFYVSPAPAIAGASVVDPTLVMTSFACTPASPAGAVAATIPPAFVVINTVVVELDLRTRTIAGMTVGERPGVYLDERWALEDHSGHWLFADGTAIILGIGLEGTELNLNPRSPALTVEVPRED